MSYIRLANFFQLYSIRSNGTERTERRYSNASPGESLSYEGVNYPYLSFIYQGAAKNRTGDNIEAALVLATNKLSTGIARDALNYRWHLRVWSAQLNSTGGISRILTTEDWLVSSMTYDPEKVEVILSSGIDAVGANAPTRTLTRGMVGALPVTGNITTQ